jgi:Zn finger protein HypA/HybF involved in hydrogenase expression
MGKIIQEVSSGRLCSKCMFDFGAEDLYGQDRLCESCLDEGKESHISHQKLNANCPICGGRGYTIEKFGDDIEYNGCIICFSEDKEKVNERKR